MIKKIGLGVGFWAIMFIGVAAVMLISMPSIVQQILEIVLAGVAGYVLAMIYFKKTPGSLKDGAILAVIWLVVATVLDLALTVQYMKGSGGYVDGLKNLYGKWELWVSFVVFIGAVVLAAKMTHGGDVMKSPVSPASPPQSPPPPPPQSPPTPPAPPAPPQSPPAPPAPPQQPQV